MPVDILEASFAAMNEAGSFHFQLDGTLKPTAGGLDLTVPIRLVGDFQAPDRVRTKLTVSLGFFALEMETITIGETTYTLNVETGRWEVDSGPASALPSPMEFTRGGTAVLESAELIGAETLNGTLVHRLRVVPPLELFGGEESKTQADFWIGVDDSLIRSFAAEGEVSIEELGGLLGNAGISGTADITVTIEFSDYNVPVVIEAPQTP